MTGRKLGWVAAAAVVGLVGGLLVIAAAVGALVPMETLPAGDGTPTPVDRRPAPPAADDAASPESKLEPKPMKRRPPSYLVAHVVDGDTIDLDNGETVRLVGIDTPESGACGYERASAALARMVDGRRVVLRRSDEDRDGYGRLLRYVDVGSVDTGLRLIRRGLAIARYDSRDGYGYHPREDRYIAADDAAPDISCQQPRGFVAAAPDRAAPGCEDGYDPCVPLYPPDLDCADVGPVTVTGPDPHGLDRDGDGLACGGD